MTISARSALVLALAGLSLAATLLSGCPGSLEDPERFSSSLSACGDVPQVILVQRCASPGCHTSREKTSDLDFQSPGVADRLVGQPGSTCKTVLVDPAAPRQSLLYLKVSGQPTCGSRMPLGDRELSAAELACLEQWMKSLGGAGAAGASGASGGGGAGGAGAGGDGGSGGSSGAGGAGGS